MHKGASRWLLPLQTGKNQITAAQAKQRQKSTRERKSKQNRRTETLPSDGRHSFPLSLTLLLPSCVPASLFFLPYFPSSIRLFLSALLPSFPSSLPVCLTSLLPLSCVPPSISYSLSSPSFFSAIFLPLCFPSFLIFLSHLFLSS